MDVVAKKSGSAIHAGTFTKTTSLLSPGTWTEVTNLASYVGRTTNYNSTGSASYSVSIATDTTEGNFLVLVVKTGSRTVTAVSDSQGNAWTIDKTAGTGPRLCVASTPLTTALIAGVDTITITLSASGDIACAAYEYFGIADSAPDKNASANGTGTTAACGPTAATTQAYELSISAVGMGGTDMTGATHAGYTLRESGKPTTSFEMADKVLTATGTESPSWTVSSGDWVAIVQTYKALGGAGTYSATLSTEPTTVSYGGIPLPQDTTNPIPERGTWFWTGGVLYVNVGVDPTSGIVVSETSLHPGRGTSFTGTAIADFDTSHINAANSSEVADPLGQRGTVIKIVTANADIVPPNTHPESNLPTPWMIEPGKEYWVAASFMFPSGNPSCAGTTTWPTVGYKWNIALQIDHGPPWGDVAPITLKVGCFTSGQEHFVWQRTANDEGHHNDIPWSMEMVYDQWIDVLCHFRNTATGWVEMWINGSRITFFDAGYPVQRNPDGHATTTRLTTKMIEPHNNAGNNRCFVENYHQSTLGTSIVYHDYLRIGSTRHSVGG